MPESYPEATDQITPLQDWFRPPEWQPFEGFVWDAQTSSPSIGNGTISARYHRASTMLHYHVEIEMGSTTSFGSGNYTFNFPVLPVNNRCIGMALAVDAPSGSPDYIGTFFKSGDLALIKTNGEATNWRSDAPFVWASGDTLVFDIAYEVAAIL